MNTRLQEVIQYKTGGRQNIFAELCSWTPQYLSKLLKGKDFGLQPVRKILEVIPELNARWFLMGEGNMLSDEARSTLKREAIEHAQRIMDYERLIPVMTSEELRQFEQFITGQRKAVFSPAALSELNERTNERIREINAKFAAANAKSDELCKQKTVRK